MAQGIVFCTEHCFCTQSFVFFEEGITDVTQSSAYKRAVYKISVHRALLIYTELHNPGKALCCNYASIPLQTPVQSGISGAQSSRKAYCYTELQGRQVLAQSIVFCTEHCFCTQSIVFCTEHCFCTQSCFLKTGLLIWLRALFFAQSIAFVHRALSFLKKGLLM